jgi:choline monooxygenase
MNTPAFDQGRIVYDPSGTGLSEQGVHHFHGLVLEAYRNLVGLSEPGAGHDAHAAPALTTAGV